MWPPPISPLGVNRSHVLSMFTIPWSSRQRVSPPLKHYQPPVFSCHQSWAVCSLCSASYSPMSEGLEGHPYRFYGPINRISRSPTDSYTCLLPRPEGVACQQICSTHGQNPKNSTVTKLDLLSLTPWWSLFLFGWSFIMSSMYPNSSLLFPAVFALLPSPPVSPRLMTVRGRGLQYLVDW